MNTDEFLALCESDPGEANWMVAEAAGWTDLQWKRYDQDYLMGKEPGFASRHEVKDYVHSLDAAWPLAEVERLGAKYIRMEASILAGDAGLSFDTSPQAAARCICAAFLQAHGKLSD